MTDHHLTPVRTPLSYLNWKLGPAMYEIKNCKIMEPCANAFQASFPHKLSLSAQLIFFLYKVASFIILKSMWIVIVWSCAAAKRQETKQKNACTNKVFNVPLAFQVTDWLDQSGYHLLIPTPIHWHACSCQTFCHSLQLEWPSLWIFHFQNFRNICIFLAETCKSGEEWLQSSLMPAHERDSKWQCSQISN